MPELHPAQRVTVLADSNNLYHTARSLHSRNVDYTALLEQAVQNRNLVRAIAYVIQAQAPEEERFFEALADIGFHTKMKGLRTYADGSKTADWDVGMSLDAITLADHVDVIVLCTGDGDFTRLCSHLRHEGVRVEIMAFEPSTADSLVAEADAFIDMNEDPERFLLSG